MRVEPMFCFRCLEVLSIGRRAIEYDLNEENKLINE